MQLSVTLPHVHSTHGYAFLWDYLLENGRAADPAHQEARPADFLAFCLRNSAHSKAQLMQDLYVLYRLPKQSGFFVEFGATDGLTISNTWLLENRMGWSGVVAEPLPSWHPALLRNRRCTVDLRCVWTTTGEQMEFLAAQNSPELSTLADFRDADHHRQARAANAASFTVETVSLNDLLLSSQAPQHFDYLSVDTEGSELAILSSLDFDRWRPRIITVEHNYVAAQRDSIHALLTGLGYVRELEAFSKWDDWYVHPGLLPLSPPA